jgi:hypothetical protein
MDVDAEERYSDVILRLAKVLGQLLFSALDRRKCLTSAARLATERRGCVRACRAAHTRRMERSLAAAD